LQTQVNYDYSSHCSQYSGSGKIDNTAKWGLLLLDRHDHVVEMKTEHALLYHISYLLGIGVRRKIAHLHCDKERLQPSDELP
jgi:hypothetical protein